MRNDLSPVTFEWTFVTREGEKSTQFISLCGGVEWKLILKIATRESRLVEKMNVYHDNAENIEELCFKEG